MAFKKIIYLFFLAIIACSCKKDEPVSSNDLGYSYFPTEIKRYIIYDVDSIVHDDFTNTIDTFKYQLKEYIDISFTDNAGRNTLRIERSVKYYNPSVPYSSIPWTLKNVWYANRTNTTAERVEENQRYVKLIFPVVNKKSWNGNASNTLGEKEYVYTEVNVPKTIGPISSDSTLSVTQQNSENLIEKKYYVEVYAKNIGMVSKEIIDVQSNTIIPGVPIMERITSGLEFKMYINSYGTN
jgi:hypothetical protein